MYESGPNKPQKQQVNDKHTVYVVRPNKADKIGARTTYAKMNVFSSSRCRGIERNALHSPQSIIILLVDPS